eukprot:2924137-Rhodomonas_salina.1
MAANKTPYMAIELPTPSLAKNPLIKRKVIEALAQATIASGPAIEAALKEASKVWDNTVTDPA